MSVRKTALVELTSGFASDDVIDLVDVSDTTFASTGTNKKATLENVFGNIPVDVDALGDVIRLTNSGGSGKGFKLVSTSTFIGYGCEAPSGQNGFYEITENGTKKAGIETNAASNITHVGAFNGHNLTFGASDAGDTDADVTIDSTTGDVTIHNELIQTPSSSVTPDNNGDLVVEATSNTVLTFKLKGTDGTVRTGTIALS